jgi:DHA2 family multidrug resistance protein
MTVNLYIAGVFGGGLGLGVPLAGYFAQFYTWRAIFLLIVPIGALAAASCWMAKSKTPHIEHKPFDYFGFLTFATFVSTILIALTMGPIPGTDEGWNTPYIKAFLATGMLALICCIWIESRHPNPLFPLPLFKNPIFSVSLAAMFLLGMATFASVSVSIQYMLNALYYEKFITSQIAAVYGLTIGIVSVLANYLIKIVWVPILTFIGLSLLIFSYFYNNELSWLTGYSEVITILLIRGTGIGLALGPTTLLALKDIPDNLKTSAATILTFFRQVGGTYGGILISIFSIRQTIFHTARFGEQINEQLPAYKMTLKNLYDKFPDPAQAKAAIVKNVLTQAYIQGMNDALIIFGYVTGAVALILAFLIGYRALKDKKQPS